MRKQRRNPGKKQRREFVRKIKLLAAALHWLASFVYIVLGILKLWNELAG